MMMMMMVMMMMKKIYHLLEGCNERFDITRMKEEENKLIERRKIQY